MDNNIASASYISLFQFLWWWMILTVRQRTLTPASFAAATPAAPKVPRFSVPGTLTNTASAFLGMFRNVEGWLMSNEKNVMLGAAWLALVVEAGSRVPAYTVISGLWARAWRNQVRFNNRDDRHFREEEYMYMYVCSIIYMYNVIYMTMNVIVNKYSNNMIKNVICIAYLECSWAHIAWGSENDDGVHDNNNKCKSRKHGLQQ